MARLHNGDFAGADPGERQMLIQEFFFHLVGARDFAAQVVRARLTPTLGPETRVPTILKALAGTDTAVAPRLRELLDELFPKRHPWPCDNNPVRINRLRAVLFRNIICHHGTSKFLFEWPGRGCYLALDPRRVLKKGNTSAQPIFDDLASLLEAVGGPCLKILELLDSMP